MTPGAAVPRGHIGPRRPRGVWARPAWLTARFPPEQNVSPVQGGGGSLQGRAEARGWGSEAMGQGPGTGPAEARAPLHPASIRLPLFGRLRSPEPWTLALYLGAALGLRAVGTQWAPAEPWAGSWGTGQAGAEGAGGGVKALAAAPQLLSARAQLGLQN